MLVATPRLGRSAYVISAGYWGEAIPLQNRPKTAILMGWIVVMIVVPVG